MLINTHVAAGGLFNASTGAETGDGRGIVWQTTFMRKPEHVMRTKPELAREKFPLANSKATLMLAVALRQAQEKRGLSQRQLAKKLNYKQSVVLSHMASGRVPIPIDRATELAEELGMDRSHFLMAVLEQRHPDVDFKGLLGSQGKASVDQPDSTDLAFSPESHRIAEDLELMDELEAFAGGRLVELPPDQLRVMKEVAADPNAYRRWLSIHEVPVIELIRKARPDVSLRGLNADERRRLQFALRDTEVSDL